MNRSLVCLLLLPMFWFVSCKPDPLETTVSPVDAKMVINSLITPDNSLWISVTNSNVPLPVAGTSLQALGDFIKTISVNDAIVTLTVNHHTDTLRLESPGMYTADSFPVIPGSVYLLTVFRPSSGETAFAFSRMPATSKITEYRAWIKPGPKNNLCVDVTFEDNNKTTDYYIASYLGDDLRDWKENPVQLLGLFLSHRSDFDLVNDEKQTAGLIHISKTLPAEYLRDTLTVLISPTEEGYYRFLEQNKHSGGLISQLAGEVVRYNSNVQGGYGYFSMRLSDVVRIPPSAFAAVK